MGFWDVFNSEGQGDDGDDQSSKPIDYEKSVGISQTHSTNNEVYGGNRISQTEGSSTVQQGTFSGLGQVASNVGLTIGHTFNGEGQGDGIHYAESVGFSKTHSANNELYDGSRIPLMVGSSTAQQGAYAASDIGQTLNSEGQGGFLPPQPNYYQESTQQDAARQQMSGVANFMTQVPGAANLIAQVPGADNLIAQVPRVTNFITQVPEAANLIAQVPGAANFLPFMQELSNVQGGSSAVPTFNSEGQGGSLPPQPIDYGESAGSFKTNSANNESNVQGGSSAVQKSSFCGMGEAFAAFLTPSLTDTPTLKAGDSSVPTPQANYPNFAPMPQGNYQNITAMPEVNYSNFTPTPQVKDYQSTGWGAAQGGFSQGLSNQGNGWETGSQIPLPQVVVTDDDPSQPTNVVIVEDDEGAAILGGFYNGRDAGSRLPQQQHIFLSDDPSKPTIVVVEDSEGTNAGAEEMTPNLYSGDVSQFVPHIDSSHPNVVAYGEPIMEYYEPTWEQGGGVPLGVPTSGWNETYVPQGREPNIGGGGAIYMPVTYNNPVY